MPFNSPESIAHSQRERICALVERAAKATHLQHDPTETAALVTKIKQRMREQDAVLVAHYYVDDSIQDLADATGGCVADSLEMARFGKQHAASTVIVAGVRFMGETAKILSPEKRVLVVENEAECSLDLACPADAFARFCAQHPERTVVVYANTSAEVKAVADWAVTSSIALKVVSHLKEQGKKIIWAPDKYLGDYIANQTGADMVQWQAACVVHESFKAQALKSLMQLHPDAGVLVHPESPPEVIALADRVGSTSQIIKAAIEMPEKKFIVATEPGIFHKMQQHAPGKTFLAAPTAGDGATCESCAFCPWMKMNDLDRLLNVLESGKGEVHIPMSTIDRAQQSITRMVNFAAS